MEARWQRWVGVRRFLRAWLVRFRRRLGMRCRQLVRVASVLSALTDGVWIGYVKYDMEAEKNLACLCYPC